jgi:hypothetical protein
MASDIFGNEVGNFVVIDQNMATITVSGTSGDAFVLGANVTYNMPVQPVLTFGKDVIMAKGVAQGTFSFSHVAGAGELAKGVKTSIEDCIPTAVTITFTPDQTCDLGTKIKILQGSNQATTVVCQHAIWTQFSIQGQAQDTFFTENAGGVFHYLGNE